MSATLPQVGVAPFDAVAVRYDETFTSSKIGLAQRASVWRELETAFRSGDRVLEIGCGTGVDACFLAERGVRVVACDSSSQMIAMASRRIWQSGQQELVRPVLLHAENIATVPAEGMFDGAFSNFGALNCVEDLRKLARDLAALLKPGGTALLCLMGPCCLWEMIWYLAHGDRDKAFRRLVPHGVDARLAEGASVRVRYPSVKSLARSFAPEFRLKSIKGVGIAVPPSYVEGLVARFPRTFGFCVRVDSILGRCPGVRLLGDHIAVRLERKS